MPKALSCIFAEPSTVPSICILGYVVLATVVILILEFAASYVIAKIEYPKDFRVSEEYVDIKNGQLVMQQIEDDS